MLALASRPRNKAFIRSKLTILNKSSCLKTLHNMSGEHELLPDFLEVADSSAGKTKRRKSQSQQEFEAQKLIYKDGPVIQTEDWLFKIKQFDPTSKVDRGYLKNAAERAYFLKDYPRALEILEVAKDWDIGSKDRQELENIRDHCVKKLAQ